MILHRTGLSILLIGMLSGCQTQGVRDNIASLASAKPCCETLADLPYVVIAAEEEKSIPLDAESPAFLFDEGKRYFQAFSFPPWTGPVQVTIYSDVNHFMGGGSKVVKPVVKLLDEDFNQVRVVRANIERHWQGSKFELTFFINEENANERHMVIHPSGVDGAKGISANGYSPVQVGHGLLAVPVTVGSVTQQFRHTFAPAGSMRIKVKPYRPVIVGQEP